MRLTFLCRLAMLGRVFGRRAEICTLTQCKLKRWLSAARNRAAAGEVVLIADDTQGREVQGREVQRGGGGGLFQTSTTARSTRTPCSFTPVAPHFGADVLFFLYWKMRRPPARISRTCSAHVFPQLVVHTDRARGQRQGEGWGLLSGSAPYVPGVLTF